MAIGIGNLPYTMPPVSPFDVITSQAENERIANIESLADGTGIGDGAVSTSKIADGAITAPKIDFATFEYSFTEKVVGKWVDGKTIYSKTINFGALPNATTKSVAHGITGLDYVIKYEAISHRTSDNLRVPIPRTNTAALNLQSSIEFDNTNITIVSAANLSTYNINYITLYYTKV